MNNHPPLGPMREERRRVNERILEIDAQVAESKRAWVCERKTVLTLQQRASLEAELASLRLQRVRLNVLVKDEERRLMDELHAARRTSVLGILTALLAERGLEALLKEAQARHAALAPAETTV